MSTPIVTPQELLEVAQATDQAGGIYSNASYQELITAIKTNSGLGLFSAHTSFVIENSKPPKEIFMFHNEFRARGYHTRFDIITSTSGIFTVTWSHPDFVDRSLVEKQVWSYNLISTTASAILINASELYLSQTNGVDLRAVSFELVMKDIDLKLRQKISKSGIKDYNDPDDDTLKYHIVYTGPKSLWSEVMAKNDGVVVNVAAASLTTLFDSVRDELEEAGYKVVITEEVNAYTWTIIWNDPPEPDPEP